MNTLERINVSKLFTSGRVRLKSQPTSAPLWSKNLPTTNAAPDLYYVSLVETTDVVLESD